MSMPFLMYFMKYIFLFMSYYNLKGMFMAKTFSCILVGVEVIDVEIETMLGNGFSGLNILGLSSEITRDMRERIRSALESVGLLIPARRVVVNIYPRDVIKISRIPLSQLDFAVAASIIYALFQKKEKQQLLYQPTKEYFAGELSLSGELKKIQNPLIYHSILSRDEGEITLCMPKENTYSDNFSNFQNIEYFSSLQNWLQIRKIKVVKNKSESVKNINTINPKNNDELNLKVTEIEKLIIILMKNPKLCVSLLVAAFGGHHILVAGEPGVGKSFSLQKIPILLNPLTDKEKIEVKLIHSVSHDVQKPFRSPHHSATPAALIGGSSLKPGEVSLAHNGVLFLDELAEFSSSSLESLREPLDSGEVYLSRAGGSIRYPANFQLCATTNPCSCGFLFSKNKPCRCNQSDNRKYLQKISGPLLDRFCLQIWIEPNQDESLFTSDLFMNFMIEKIRKGNLSEFIISYLNIKSKQNEIEEMKKCKEELYLIRNILQKNNKFLTLSLRGQEKIVKLVYSFKIIFKDIQYNDEFIDSIFNYRTLDKMFLQRDIF